MSSTQVTTSRSGRPAGPRWLAAALGLGGLAAASLAGAGPATASANTASASAASASAASGSTASGSTASGSTASGSTGAARGAAGPARVALPDPVAASRPRGLTDAGPAGRRVEVSVRLYLAGRDPAAEARFATAVSTPGSGAYGRFLSPARFAARFGPTRTQVAAVTSWARSAGLRVTGVNGHDVAVRGTAPVVGAAFGTRLEAYLIGGRPAGLAAAGGASVPAALGGDVIAVLGLDTLSAAPASVRIPARTPVRTPAPAAPAAASGLACSAWWGQHVSRIPKAEGKTRADDAICGYTPQQLRSAYGVTASSGRGATIAVVLDGSLATMRADANRFFARHHLAGFASGQYVQNFGAGFGKSCHGSADVPEEPLDVETAHIIAPAAKIIYVAANCGIFDTPAQDQNFLDAETRIVDHHLASVETESVSTVESTYPAAMRTAWTKVLEQGAAEGIGFNFDAGDGGDLSPPTFPASDPWATGVGATDLEIGRTGAVVGELGWGDTATLENKAGTGYQQRPPGTLQEGTTGGRSLVFAEPAYQRGVVPAALATGGGKLAAHRVLPDVSAIGGATTGWLIGYHVGAAFGQVTEAGTSGSSPVIAALEADAKQAVGHALGFANPLLYRLRRTAGIRDIRPPASPALVLSPPGNCAAAAGKCLITQSLDGSLHVTRGFDEVTGVGAATRRFVTAVRRLLG
jgi:subtilase family serine protease